MKKIIASALLLLFITTDLSAGATTDVPVIVDLVNSSAQGSQTSARFSDNDVELIGCGSTTVDDGDSSPTFFGFCQATDAEGNSATCFTFSPDLVDAIRAVSAYSFISFSWNEEDECTRVRASSQSIYVPSFKLKN